MTETYLTVTDLAEMVGVPKGTVYAWATRGGGPRRLRVGRHVRFRLSDVEAWLTSVERGTAA